jgi:hypothetical protein
MFSSTIKEQVDEINQLESEIASKQEQYSKAKAIMDTYDPKMVGQFMFEHLYEEHVSKLAQPILSDDLLWCQWTQPILNGSSKIMFKVSKDQKLELTGTGDKWNFFHYKSGIMYASIDYSYSDAMKFAICFDVSSICVHFEGEIPTVESVEGQVQPSNALPDPFDPKMWKSIGNGISTFTHTF